MIWFCSEIKTGHNEIERIMRHFALFLYHFIWLELVFIDGFFWLEKLRKEIGFEGTKLSIYLDWSIFRTFSIEMNNWDFFATTEIFVWRQSRKFFTNLSITIKLDLECDLLTLCFNLSIPPTAKNIKLRSRFSSPDKGFLILSFMKNFSLNFFWKSTFF